MAQDKQSRERTEVELRCTHSAPVHCLLSFLVRKVMQKY